MSVRLMIVEDEPAIARNLAQIVGQKGYEVVGVAFNRQEAEEFISSHTFDLALLDINLGGNMEGIEIGKLLSEQYQVPFIFITSYADEQTIAAAKQARPKGYIIKPFDEKEIYAAIEIAWHNNQNPPVQKLRANVINAKLIEPLTLKEFEILQDLIQGKPYAQIALSHFISINTVNTHVKKIYAKLGVSSKIEALHFCLKTG